ncbi:MAG: IS1595 family transposase [Candidatus Sulfotelmatobacter sp.]
MKAPKTLQEAIVYFSDPDRAFEYAVKLRWPDGKIICPRCSSDKHWFISAKTRKGTPRKLWLCRGCNRQFTLKVNTIFEDSALPLDKWMTAFWMLVNCKNGVSSMEIHRTLGITQKSAWFMLQRLRTALHDRSFGSTTKMGGPDSEVEADETFIGGLTKNMHKSRKLNLVKQGGIHGGKTVVQGILDRNLRQVRATVVPNVKRETLQNEILKNVKYGTKVYTDDAVAYEQGMQWRFVHDVINHSEAYVRGQVHTNGLENFWSLLKRGLRGTYVAVEPFHLFRYVDEQVFRYNNRKDGDHKLNDADRFARAMSQVAGRRLTYSELTGKDGSPRHVPTGTGETVQEPF